MISIEDAKKRYASLASEQSPHISDWMDVVTYLQPRRGKFQTNHQIKKEVDRSTLLNSTPIYCVEKFSGGMQTGITSETKKWFKLSIEGFDAIEQESIRETMVKIEDLFQSIFSKSNFYDSCRSFYSEWCSFGNGVMLIDEDYEKAIKCTTFTAGEYFIGDNVFARIIPMSVSKIVDEFGYENCSSAVKNQYDNKNYMIYHNVYHLIDKNRSKDHNKKDNLNMPFFSCYWESNDEGKFLKQSGYKEFPVLIANFDKIKSDEVYGLGVGTLILGDLKTLQELEKKYYIGLSKVVDPPLDVPDTYDVVNTLPGGISRSSGNIGNQKIQPVYQVNFPFAEVKEKINVVEYRIKQAFYVDLFLMLSELDRGQMTAREVIERNKEKLESLAPIIGSLRNQFLDPLIDRVFSICERLGLLPEFPPEMQGRNIKIDYISPLFEAMKMIETTAIEQSVSFVGSVSSQFPEVLDNIDSDKMVKEYINILGASRILKKESDVEQLRSDKMQAQAMEQQRIDAQNAIQGAQVMSQTPVGTNSALDAMLQGVSGGFTQ